MCTACRRTTQKAAAPIHTSPAHTSHMYIHTRGQDIRIYVYILHYTLYTFYTVYFTLYTVQVYINTLLLGLKKLTKIQKHRSEETHEDSET